MRPVKLFEEFITEGIVDKRYSDKSRANFLAKESEKSYLFVNQLAEKIGINDDSANSIIKLCYDVMMEMIRALMLTKGYVAKGQGAHEAEIAYLRKLGFTENAVQFADQLRYFRNGITYYGKIMDGEYAKKVFGFMNKVYPGLKKPI